MVRLTGWRRRDDDRPRRGRSRFERPRSGPPVGWAWRARCGRAAGREKRRRTPLKKGPDTFSAPPLACRRPEFRKKRRGRAAPIVRRRCRELVSCQPRSSDFGTTSRAATVRERSLDRSFSAACQNLSRSGRLRIRADRMAGNDWIKSSWTERDGAACHPRPMGCLSCRRNRRAPWSHPAPRRLIAWAALTIRGGPCRALRM